MKDRIALNVFFVNLRMVDVVQRTPQLRSGHMGTNFRQAGCSGMKMERMKMDYPRRRRGRCRAVSVAMPGARGVGWRRTTTQSVGWH